MGNHNKEWAANAKLPSHYLLTSISPLCSFPAFLHNSHSHRLTVSTSVSPLQSLRKPPIMAAQSPIRIRKSQTPSSRSRTFLFESEAIRLQRTVDNFTVKLEQERRQDILLSEQIRILEEELKRKKERLGPGVASTTEERKLNQKIAALSHELHLLAMGVADTQTYNKTIKQAIEGCRREQTNYRAAIKTLSAELAEISQEATAKNSE